MAKMIGTPITITKGLGGSGGPLTTPDWNQNDETASDYVKNRTHYEYLDDANLVLPMSTVNCDVEGDDWGYITEFEAHYLGTLPTSIDLDSSDVFTVFLDGQYYECIPDPIWGEEGIPSPEYVIVGSCIGGNLGNAFGDVFSMEPELPFAICGDTIAVYEQGQHTIAIWKGTKSVKKLDEKFLPDSMKRSSYIATIGTTWEEDSETGVKYQVVAIDALTGADDEKAFVDHTDTSIDGTSDGYALFVAEENEFLTYITNGRAETVEGGIRFEIFGDANTIEIPIEVRVG